MDFKDCIDFRLNLNVNRDIKVLQITDMQPVDWSQQRYDGRLSWKPYNTPFTKKDKYENEFYYLEKAIKDNNPDLIIVTGDNVYGEFDDNGNNLVEFVNFMDSFKIPWAPVFGNHDNESKKGVTWQCKQFEEAKYCLFKRNNVTGNGNYNIGIFNNNELLRVIYMIDSNGAWHGKEYGYLENYPPYNLNEKIEKHGGIFPDQIEYITNTSKEIDKVNEKVVKKTICFHIAPSFINKYAFIKGYVPTDANDSKDMFDLGGTCLIDNKDFGVKREGVCSFDSKDLDKVLKDLSFDTMFIGHDHINTFSIDCDGLRVSYGIKSSTFDYFNDDLIGSLLFSIVDKNDYKIEHKFSDMLPLLNHE